MLTFLTTTFLGEMKSENLQGFGNNYYKVVSIFRPLSTPVFDCFAICRRARSWWQGLNIGGSTQQNVSCFTSLSCWTNHTLMLPANTLDSGLSHGWTLQVIWPWDLLSLSVRLRYIMTWPGLTGLRFPYLHTAILEVVKAWGYVVLQDLYIYLIVVAFVL